MKFEHKWEIFFFLSFNSFSLNFYQQLQIFFCHTLISITLSTKISSQFNLIWHSSVLVLNCLLKLLRATEHRSVVDVDYERQVCNLHKKFVTFVILQLKNTMPVKYDWNISIINVKLRSHFMLERITGFEVNLSVHKLWVYRNQH